MLKKSPTAEETDVGDAHFPGGKPCHLELDLGMSSDSSQGRKSSQVPRPAARGGKSAVRGEPNRDSAKNRYPERADARERSPKHRPSWLGEHGILPARVHHKGRI